jgi:hypothetical protein
VLHRPLETTTHNRHCRLQPYSDRCGTLLYCLVQNSGRIHGWPYDVHDYIKVAPILAAHTPRPAARDSPTSQRANLVMRRCTQSASPATRLQKTVTRFSLATHLRPELNDAPILGGMNFFNPQGWLAPELL